MIEITVQLPEDIVRSLEVTWKNLPRAVLEALAIEAYRTGILTPFQTRTLLGLTRYELDGLLKHHNVLENALSLEDFLEEEKKWDPIKKTE